MSGYGVSRDWREAVDQALAALEPMHGRASVGFLYATDYFASAADSIRRLVVERTGVTVLSGTVGMGVCCTSMEFMNTPAVVLMLLRVPDGVASEVIGCDDLVSGEHGAVTIAHIDPREGRGVGGGPQFGGAFLIGALTSSRGPSVQFHRDGIEEEGATGVAFGEGIEVQSGLTQGCTPLAGWRRVTRAMGPVLIELDNRPALDVLMEDAAGIVAGDVERLRGRVFAAVALPNRDRADYVVRNLIGVDIRERAVAIAQPCQVGQTVQFMRRDPDAAAEDMTRMLRELKGRTSRTPAAALYFSCVGRGQNLFDTPGRELELITDVLGDLPLVGFFGNGEICHRYIYGYTGVLALLYAPKDVH